MLELPRLVAVLPTDFKIQSITRRIEDWWYFVEWKTVRLHWDQGSCLLMLVVQLQAVIFCNQHCQQYLDKQQSQSNISWPSQICPMRFPFCSWRSNQTLRKQSYAKLGRATLGCKGLPMMTLLGSPREAISCDMKSWHKPSFRTGLLGMKRWPFHNQKHAETIKSWPPKRDFQQKCGDTKSLWRWKNGPVDLLQLHRRAPCSLALGGRHQGRTKDLTSKVMAQAAKCLHLETWNMWTNMSHWWEKLLLLNISCLDV